MAEYKGVIETIRHVYPEDYEAYISVEPDGDGLGCVRIHVPKDSENYFGKMDLTVLPGFAKALAHAILKLASEIEAEKESS